MFFWCPEHGIPSYFWSLEPNGTEFRRNFRLRNPGIELEVMDKLI